MSAATAKKRTSTISRTDVYTRVTDRIVADLEQGVRPWAKPWNADHAAGRITLPRRHNGEPYRGINILLLWGETMAKGFAQPIWMTYRQAVGAEGAGPQGRARVARRLRRPLHEDGTGRARPGRRARHPVPEGLHGVQRRADRRPARALLHEDARSRASPCALIEAAEAFFAATGATIRHAGNQAYYSPSADVVVLPRAGELPRRRELRRDEGARTRRTGRSTRPGSTAIWAASASAMTATPARNWSRNSERRSSAPRSASPCEPREDHAAYLAHWLRILKADKRAIFQAASHAQKAVDYLCALASPAPTADDHNENRKESRPLDSLR